MVRNPAVFLMDEPLSNLDAGLRVKTRTEIKQLQRNLGITSIFVTHDQEEAMVLSDQIAVMRNGQLQQHGPPMEVIAIRAICSSPRSSARPNERRAGGGDGL